MALSLFAIGCNELNVCADNNAKIGANAVVVEDIPDGATCVLTKPRVIINKEGSIEINNNSL